MPPRPLWRHLDDASGMPRGPTPGPWYWRKQGKSAPTSRALHSWSHVYLTQRGCADDTAENARDGREQEQEDDCDHGIGGACSGLRDARSFVEERSG